MKTYRDLLRRRNILVHLRSEALAHIKLTNSQYNLPVFEKHLGKSADRIDVAERFIIPSVRVNVEVDLSVADYVHVLMTQM